jgi:hypothetical protein
MGIGPSGRPRRPIKAVRISRVGDRWVGDWQGGGDAGGYFGGEGGGVGGVDDGYREGWARGGVARGELRGSGRWLPAGQVLGVGPTVNTESRCVVGVRRCGGGRAGAERDLAHAAAATGTEVEGVAGGRLGRVEVFGCGSRPQGCRDGQQLTAEREFGGAMAVGEKAVMTDAVKAVGQDMQEETANEFVGREGHHLALAGMAIVFPAEADAAVVGREEPAVGDRDVGLAGEVGEDLAK